MKNIIVWLALAAWQQIVWLVINYLSKYIIINRTECALIDPVVLDYCVCFYLQDSFI